MAICTGLALWIFYAYSNPRHQKSPALTAPLQLAKNPTIAEDDLAFEREAFFYDKPVTKARANKVARKDIYAAKLKGTVIVHPKENSLAFVEEPGQQESQLLKVGDLFMGAKVKGIDQDNIVLQLDQNEILLSVFNDKIDVPKLEEPLVEMPSSNLTEPKL